MLFSSFVNIIKKNRLFEKNDYIVAAVSGGADSVCLLHLLYRLRKEWNNTVVCAHVNHCLRQEAHDDACFVRGLCEKWGIPFLLHTVNIAEKSNNEKISLELAGRNARYDFFKSIGADVILTAHTKNDAVESFFLHLTRGCGLEGLCGIPVKREDGICRPLLEFTRDQIESYLIHNSIEWREDASNKDIVYTRNNIRHEILPIFLKMNPSFLDAMGKTIDILNEENNFVTSQLDELFVLEKDGKDYIISLNRLISLPIALRRRVIKKFTDNFYDVNEVLNLVEKKTGCIHILSNGLIAQREYSYISIYSRNNKVPKNELLLPSSGEIQFGEYRIKIGETGLALPKQQYIIRTRRKGDVFVPEGMMGHKKVGDFFTDMKIPQRNRDIIPIITFKDKIASIGDLRRDVSFVPKDDNIIHIKIEKNTNV